MKKWLKFILVPIGFLIFIGALYLLSDQLKSLSYADIKNALTNIPANKILLAMLLALLYYLLLGGYDVVAYNYIDAKVPLKFKDIVFTCFISNALGNNTGYSMLFGGSLRYRLYSIHNVSMLVVTKVLFFSSATIWLGLLTIGGIIFIVSPVSLAQITGYDISSKVVGILFLSILALYISLSLLNIKTIPLIKKKITLPNIKIIAWQIFLATGDWIIASLTLWTLMPAGEIPYFVLLKVFLVSQLLGILSQVPGGMGVFEASIAMLLPQAMNNPAVIGGLLIYRAVFYFFPLSVALVMLASYEIARLIKKVDEKTKMIGKAFSSIIVQVLGILSFFAGMFAVFITATPPNIEDIKKFFDFIPLWIFDVSHFLLSIISAGLLFVSRAIQLRISSARFWACILLALAVILSIIIGEHPALIGYFILLFIVFFYSKQYFYRTRSMLNLPLSAWWYFAIGAVLILSVWMGFFINGKDLLAQINLHGFFNTLLIDNNAARFARSALGITIIFLIVILEHCFNNPLRKKYAYDQKDIESIIGLSDYTYAFAARMANKKFLLNDKKNAFIMYENCLNSKIVLGDPIGKENQKGEILWKFKENADKKNDKIAFVFVDKKYMRYYKDIGLDIFHIGKKAKTLLPKFDENEIYFKEISQRVEKSGIEYEIIKADEIKNIIDELRLIDQQWEIKSNYMKRNFIPGDYDENIFKDNDYSVLKKNGKIFAFSVLVCTKNKNEFSSQIVRYTDCSSEEFVYMIYKNCVYAKENGFVWFDLGLTYFEQKEEDRNVMKYFAKTFAFVEHFNDDFEKLNEFKNRFHPVWRDKYAALSSNMNINAFIKNFTALIVPIQEKNKLEFFRRFFKR